MRVNAPNHKTTQALAADWLEVAAIEAGRRGYGYAELIGALEIDDHADGLIYDPDAHETLEDEILQLKYEPFCDAALSELQWRESVLGDLYPFAIQKVGPSWRLLLRDDATSPGQRSGRTAYLICLLIATLRYNFIDASLNPDLATNKTISTVFQAVAATAARGFLGGSTSFWFGFPRPEHDGFKDAMSRLTSAMGVGTLHEELPPSQQGKNQDAGIDIVSWNYFRDRRPVPLVAYGQVASGADWRNKSVNATLDSRFHHWLSRHPAKHYVPTMYIPFMQHEYVRETKRYDFEEILNDELISLEKSLGVVLDRTRITELTLTASVHLTPHDRKTYLQALRWFASIMRQLQRVSQP